MSKSIDAFVFLGMVKEKIDVSVVYADDGKTYLRCPMHVKRPHDRRRGRDAGQGETVQRRPGGRVRDRSSASWRCFSSYLCREDRGGNLGHPRLSKEIKDGD